MPSIRTESTSTTAHINIGSVVFIIASTYVLYQAGTIIYNIYFHPLAKFPGPSSRAGVHAFELWKFYRGEQHRNVKELHEKYGDVVRTRPDTLSFDTSAAWKDIYGSHSGKGQLQKDPRFYTLAGKQDPHIIYSNDADHSRMRKLLSHAFSDTALRQQEPLMTQYFALLVERLKERIDGPDAAIVDMTQWYNYLTFDVIGDLSFGESFGAVDSGKYHIWMKNLFQHVKYGRIFSIASFYGPVLPMLRVLSKLFPSMLSGKEEHDQFTFHKTAKRLDTKTDRKDFMSYIQRYNDDRSMSRSEIMGTVGILILAGSETTATLLSGLTYFLLKNPRVYAKVKEEVRSSLHSAEEITLTSTSQLFYLQACLEEALRIYPPVPILLPRRTHPDGDIIGGVFVPGNTSIGVTQFAASHSEKNFFEPESFVPERWLPNPPEQYQNDIKDAANPFSTGPRNCIGKNLAYSEMRSVMARMIWHFDMDLCEDSDNWTTNQPVYFMWEKPALNVKLSHRKFER